MSVRWILAAAIMAVSGAAQAAPDCPKPQPSLLFASCAGSTKAELILLDPDAGVPEDLGSADQTTLAVTGAYTSGERVEPEGLVLDQGVAFDPYVQGWDGLLLLSQEGLLSLHHVERVDHEGTVSNLRDRDARRAFVKQAEKRGLSAIQSHMLIVDGKVDVREQASAPRFRRRVVFSHENGDYGVFDSSPRALTLFEAAEEIAARFEPEMAFNLDMGSYDFCELSAADRVVDCGTLSRERTGKLSNILVFYQSVVGD